MKPLRIPRRTLAVAGVAGALLALLFFVAARSGPMAPVPVTVVSVESRSIAPALFGIGTVEARHTYRIGPTIAGRVRVVNVEVGERVKAGQLLGEMDPVDLDARVASQESGLRRAEAAKVGAGSRVREATARFEYADKQARRFDTLLLARSVSNEEAEAKRRDQQVAEAALATARAELEGAGQELARARADREGVVQQRANLRLVAPVDGLVTARDADPGTTVVGGQAVVQVVDPASLWIHARFDQRNSAGIRAGLAARVALRSRPNEVIAGEVLRVEPLADAVTEEALAKVVFVVPPVPLPSVGEMAEVTVALGESPIAPVVPNASIKRVGGRLGVWLLERGKLRFAPVQVGASDLEGRVQILAGLEPGEQVVVHSMRALDARSRVKLVKKMPGVSP